MDCMEVMTPSELDRFIEENQDNPQRMMAYVLRQTNQLSSTCNEMNEHIKKSNGNVEDLKKEQVTQGQAIDKIKENQTNILGRWLRSLPAWAQIALIVILFGAISQIGVAIKYLA